jgi:hypothetical protein
MEPMILSVLVSHVAFEVYSAGWQSMRMTVCWLRRDTSWTRALALCAPPLVVEADLVWESSL